MPRGTLVPAPCPPLRVRDCHPLRSGFPSLFRSRTFGSRRPATPMIRKPSVWPSPSSLTTTKGIDFSFFSSGYLDVSLPRVPSASLLIQNAVTGRCPRRVPPFGYPRITACLRLPAAFRSLSRPSSAISALASTLRSFSLDLFSASLAAPKTSYGAKGSSLYLLSLCSLSCAVFKVRSGPEP